MYMVTVQKCMDYTKSLICVYLIIVAFLQSLCVCSCSRVSVFLRDKVIDL